MEKCIGCELCAGVCPARCIYVRGADNPPDAPVSPGRAVRVRVRDQLPALHPLRHVRRGLPTEAITESKLFEWSFVSREDAIYTKAELLVDDEGRPQELPWEDWKPGDDRNTSAWVRATSPAGAAALEGQPLWSAELGYGVRAPQMGQSDPDAADYAADTDLSLREMVSGALRGIGVEGDRHKPHGSARAQAGLTARTEGTDAERSTPGAGRLQHRRRRAGASATSSGAHLAHASAWAVYVVGAVFILGGAFGVILLRNPVHCALMLVVTLFGVAIEFIDQAADFLAAVQIIVYAGAVVILFLFVIMFLGVDRKEAAGRGGDPSAEAARRPAGRGRAHRNPDPSRVQEWSTGYSGSRSRPGAGMPGPSMGPGENVQKLGQSIYTRYLLSVRNDVGPAGHRRGRCCGAVPAAGTRRREMSQADQEEVVTP